MRQIAGRIVHVDMPRSTRTSRPKRTTSRPPKTAPAPVAGPYDAAVAHIKAGRELGARAAAALEAGDARRALILVREALDFVAAAETSILAETES